MDVPIPFGQGFGGLGDSLHGAGDAHRDNRARNDEDGEAHGGADHHQYFHGPLCCIHVGKGVLSTLLTERNQFLDGRRHDLVDITQLFDRRTVFNGQFGEGIERRHIDVEKPGNFRLSTIGQRRCRQHFKKLCLPFRHSADVFFSTAQHEILFVAPHHQHLHGETVQICFLQLRLDRMHGSTQLTL